MAKRASTKKHAAAKTPRLVEWLFGAASGAIVVALVVYFAWQGLFADATPPRFTIAVEGIEPAGTGAGVAVRVFNGGDAAAADVTVAATAGDSETRRLTFDYVPGRSERRGTIVLPRMPGAASDVSVEVESFSEP